jgi:hypothetical protein
MGKRESIRGSFYQWSMHLTKPLKRKKTGNRRLDFFIQFDKEMKRVFNVLHLQEQIGKNS